MSSFVRCIIYTLLFAGAPAWAQPWLEASDFAADSGLSSRLTFAVEPNGMLLVGGVLETGPGGGVGSKPGVVRLRADGSVVEVLNAPFTWGDRIDHLYVVADGDIIAVGRFTIEDALRPAIRLRPDGARDTDYLVPTGLDSVEVLAIDPIGRLYFESDGVLLRLAPSGAIDSGFISPALSEPALVAPFADGTAIVKARHEWSIPMLVRLTASGSIDPAFGRVYDPEVMPYLIRRLIPLPNQGVLVVGRAPLSGNDVPGIYVEVTSAADFGYHFVGHPREAGDPAPAFELASVLHDLLRTMPVAELIQAPHVVGDPFTASDVAVMADGTLFLTELNASDFPFRLAKYQHEHGNGSSVAAAPGVLLGSGGIEETVKLGERVLASIQPSGLHPFTYQWYHDGEAVPGANSNVLSFSAEAADAGVYELVIRNDHGSVRAPGPILRLDSAPVALEVRPTRIATRVAAGETAVAGEVEVSGVPVPEVAWSFNGRAIVDGTSRGDGQEFTARVRVDDVQLEDAGIYTARISSGDSLEVVDNILGLVSDAKVIGDASEVGRDILHPNGNYYDQMLLEGAATVITADAGQVSRLSFIDLNDDIVQVELSGAGSLALVLDPEHISGPASPRQYHQPGVEYVKGHAGIVVTGANETTHLSVFSIGRANAVNQSLFLDQATYDGLADIAFVAIASDNGKFGGVYGGNASFFATRGITGLFAPGVEFQGPVYLHDIDAHDTARPLIVIGAAAGETRITGGDLRQSNGEPVTVGGLDRLRFTAGTTSHGTQLEARRNQGRLYEDGADVTEEIVGN